VLHRTETYHRLASLLPDIPRWLETRSMLLDGSAELFGFEENDESPAYIARDPDSHLLSVVGPATAEAAKEALYRNEGRGLALCQEEQQAYVADLFPGWRPEPATLHVLGDESRLPAVPDSAVRFVELAEILKAPGVPEQLRDELKSASLWSDVAATIVDGRTVAFSYVASVTETLWDISVDTLEPHRRRGYAALAVTFMIRHMARQGKRPVWGAEESNVASWSLARKLGFAAVDRLIVFHSPED
jgi:RimJ/RimL family protein N-acetyltransferase